MSDSGEVNQAGAEGELSINGAITSSYLFFMSHFNHFIRLAAGPFIIWIGVELACAYALNEHGRVYDTMVPRAMVCAAFALVWYRQFLMGERYATYLQLIDHVVSPGIFNLYSLFRSITRIVITTMILFVPTLMLSISIMFYQFSQGVLVDDAVIQDIAVKSTTMVLLFFSPVLIRLSLFSVGVALGRKTMRLRDVWRRTSGYTWVLWLLIFRAFLPITLYTYIITWSFEIISNQFSMNYVWANLFVNIPTAFLTFMMLAIVVAVNGEAFRVLIGIRTSERQ